MLTTHQSHLHGELFPEEYDRMLDDRSDARLRRQGVNPMSQDYIDRVNERRLAMGVKPYMPTQLSPEHHHRAMENPAFIDSHDYIVLHHPDNIDESELLRIPRQHVERVLSCSGMVLIADTLDWFVKVQDRVLSQQKGHDVRAIVPLAQHHASQLEWPSAMVKQEWEQILLPTLIARCNQLEQGLMFRAKQGINELCFIGDVHGQIHKLETLMERVGHQPGHRFVFIGDLIDNATNSGADHLALLTKVKEMVDSKQALCIMGNHEFNAIGWLLKKSNGDYCRDRTKPSNLKQHQLFLRQVGEDSALHHQWVEWFKRLPLFLNFGDIHVIHACWHPASIERLKPYLNNDHSLKSQYWLEAFDETTELYQLIETLLKGPEIRLPDGASCVDKTGTTREHIRVAWWKNSAKTYQELAAVQPEQRAAIPTALLDAKARNAQYHTLFPVVVGHYTLPPTQAPTWLSEQVVCVDFNAAKADHPLVGLSASLSRNGVREVSATKRSRFVVSTSVN